VKPEDIEQARQQGATDREIHDTVLIAAAFCMYNRYVNGLATWAPHDPEVSRAVDNRTRTMPVELDVRKPQAELAPGTFCEASWPVRRDYPTLFVPASSVASDLERAFVIRVSNNHVEWVDVKTGAKSGNLLEVFGNLKEGDEVAMRGTDQIRPGTMVASRLVASP